MEIQQLAAPGISLCTALKHGAATAGTSSPGGMSQLYGAGSVPVLSAYIVGMLGRRPALSGGTLRAMLYVFRPLLTLFSPLYAVFFLFPIFSARTYH